MNAARTTRVDAESAGEPGRDPGEPLAVRGPGDARAAQGVVEAVEAMSLRVGVSLLLWRQGSPRQRCQPCGSTLK